MDQAPDYSNLKMNMAGIDRFFNDQGISVSKEEKAKINTIFNECDTENKKGEKKADGELTGMERSEFLDKIKNAIPKLYKKMVDFFTVVEVVEDLEAEAEEKKELKDMEETQKEYEKLKKEEKIENSFKDFGE